MKVFRLSVLAVSAVLFCNAPAWADFMGAYEVSNWTTTTEDNSGGILPVQPSVNILGAPSSIQLLSGDDTLASPPGPGNSFVEFTIAAASSGLVSFDWLYDIPLDVGGPGSDEEPEFELFGYLLNGNFTQLTDSFGSTTQSGMISFNVNNGDIFGFRAFSVDSTFGHQTTTISNFSAPDAVPEPATIVLIGTGFLGLIAYRLKNRA